MKILTKLREDYLDAKFISENKSYYNWIKKQEAEHRKVAGVKKVFPGATTFSTVFNLPLDEKGQVKRNTYNIYNRLEKLIGNLIK